MLYAQFICMHVLCMCYIMHSLPGMPYEGICINFICVRARPESSYAYISYACMCVHVLIEFTCRLMCTVTHSITLQKNFSKEWFLSENILGYSALKFFTFS